MPRVYILVWPRRVNNSWAAGITKAEVSPSLFTPLSHHYLSPSLFTPHQLLYSTPLKGHCIEFKYYADGIHSGLTPPGNNSWPAGVTQPEVSSSLFTPLSHHYRCRYFVIKRYYGPSIRSVTSSYKCYWWRCMSKVEMITNVGCWRCISCIWVILYLKKKTFLETVKPGGRMLIMDTYEYMILLAYY